VAYGVDRSHHVHYVGVFEAADHVQDRIDLADVRQELVAEAFPLRGATHQSGDVDELNDGGDFLLGPHQLEQPVQAGVGDIDDPDVRLDGAERIVLRRRGLRRGQGVEQGRLADVGETDE